MRRTLVEAKNRATQAIPMPSEDSTPNDTARSDWILHPYNGWDDKIVYLQIERALAAQDHARAGRYPILVLGGSVAGLFCGHGAASFADEIGRDGRLKGRHVVLLDFAQGGYKQPQPALRLVWLLSLGLRPSAVIEIDGFNEVALGNANVVYVFHPLQPSRNHWLRQFAEGHADEEMKALEAEARRAKDRIVELADLGLRFGLWRSSIAGTVLARRVRAAQNEVNDSESRYLQHLAGKIDVDGASGPPIHGGAGAGMSITVEGWADGSQSMRAICEARSIPYLHVLQPTLHDEGAKPMTREEVERGIALASWIDGVRIGYPLLRARGEKLKATGLNFVDASRLFADVRETLYYDSCHFNDLGMDRFSRFVAKAFLDSLPLQER